MKLNKTTKSDMTRNDKTTFVLRERPVGLLRYVQLYNEGKVSDTNWFISYVVLSTPYNNKCYTLPCDRWLLNRTVMSLRDGAGALTDSPVMFALLIIFLNNSNNLFNFILIIFNDHFYSASLTLAQSL